MLGTGENQEKLSSFFSSVHLFEVTKLPTSERQTPIPYPWLLDFQPQKNPDLPFPRVFPWERRVIKKGQLSGEVSFRHPQKWKEKIYFQEKARFSKGSKGCNKTATKPLPWENQLSNRYLELTQTADHRGWVPNTSRCRSNRTPQYIRQ